MNDFLKINSFKETKKITFFIRNVLRQQDFENVVIGVSGGIDSAVCLSLLTKSILPKNIFIAHLSYFIPQTDLINTLLTKVNIPQKNIYNFSIKNIVYQIQKELRLIKTSKNYKLRLGNIMARTRMITLYDLAKKHNALVCGTENKSEERLGYFTKFGDEASDFEPIKHLYKTQIYQIAKHLEIPKKIISSIPTAGLWPGQTDEKELGFSYKEADRVLSLYFDQKKSIAEIFSQGFSNAKKIISRANKNSFKHRLPYSCK